jgi:hypothetical protein
MIFFFCLKNGESVFLYPDLVTSLFGDFEETSDGDVKMKKAVVRPVNGLKVPSRLLTQCLDSFSILPRYLTKPSII